MQSSVDNNEQELEELFFTGLLLPSRDYATVITQFPAGNCSPKWGTEGRFSISVNAYHAGTKVAELNLAEVNEGGVLQANFDDFYRFYDEELTGLVVIQFYHTRTIPVELYAAHFHRKTGAYIAYPSLTYMGDTIYFDAHANQMENTQFWPGLIEDGENEMVLAVLNPYRLHYSYQISLFGDGSHRHQTEVLRIRPYSVQMHSLADIFTAQEIASARKTHGALCITAQYKLAAYVMIRNKRTGVISTIDHLHSYGII